MLTFRKNPVMVEAVQVTAVGFKAALAFAGAGAAPIFHDGEPAISFNDGEPNVAKSGDWLVREDGLIKIVANEEFVKEYHPVRGPKTVKLAQAPPPIDDDDESGMAGDPLAGSPPVPRGRKK
jgi:hypothetical protein